jgi:hypothetical protein
LGVNIKLADLKKRFSYDIEKVSLLAENLKRLGVEQGNTYLFMQGHTLKDNVVQMILKPLHEILRKEKENEIKSTSKHKEQMINAWNSYKKQVRSIEETLALNTEFQSCFLYQKIRNDLDGYIANL